MAESDHTLKAKAVVEDVRNKCILLHGLHHKWKSGL